MANQLSEQVIALSETEDIFSLLNFLAQQTNPALVLEAHDTLLRHFYWKKKDVARLVMVALAGIQYGFQMAHTADLAAKETYLSGVKTLAYNLATFTWPGWGDEGIVINDTDLAIGLEAAQLNLRLAIELQKPPLRIGRAYWLLSAQQMCISKWAEARHNLKTAVVYFTEADVPNERLLTVGYQLLIDLLTEPTASTHAQWATLKEGLHPLPDGAFLVAQLDTAFSVLKDKI